MPEWLKLLLAAKRDVLFADASAGRYVIRLGRKNVLASDGMFIKITPPLSDVLFVDKFKPVWKAPSLFPAPTKVEIYDKPSGPVLYGEIRQNTAPDMAYVFSKSGFIQVRRPKAVELNLQQLCQKLKSYSQIEASVHGNSDFASSTADPYFFASCTQNFNDIPSLTGTFLGSKTEVANFQLRNSADFLPFAEPAMNRVYHRRFGDVSDLLVMCVDVFDLSPARREHNNPILALQKANLKLFHARPELQPLLTALDELLLAKPFKFSQTLTQITDTQLLSQLKNSLSAGLNIEDVLQASKQLSAIQRKVRKL